VVVVVVGVVVAPWRASKVGAGRAGAREGAGGGISDGYNDMIPGVKMYSTYDTVSYNGPATKKKKSSRAHSDKYIPTRTRHQH
jgi:hypothetical protein